jgi:hypothetical protein
MTESNENSDPKFDYRTFSILLLIGVVPMLVVTWFLFGSYEDTYLDMVGTNLSDAADTSFSLLNSYLQNQIISVAGLAESPSLRAAVTAGNTDLKGNLEEVRKSIPKAAEAWPKLDRQSAQVKAVLDNQASTFLRRYSAINPAFREIIVTDFFGRLVASTSQASGYYHAHNDWWKECYGDGSRGSVYIGDVHYDAGSKSYQMSIAQPLVDPDRGVVGVIGIVLDMQGIHALVGSIQTGSGRSVALIHAKGDVISAPGFSSLQQTTYPATLEILKAREREKRYFLASTPSPTVYGMTKRSFTEMYPHLNWIVVTSGHVSDVKGPLPELRKYFISLVAGMFVLALIATLMLSRMEAKPILEEDPHLEKL